MKRLGQMYSMRATARKIGRTDPRTALANVYKLGIPTVETDNSILIDEAGLNRLIDHYTKMRSKQAAGAA